MYSNNELVPITNTAFRGDRRHSMFFAFKWNFAVRISEHGWDVRRALMRSG
jgi:hypothetical protein